MRRCLHLAAKGRRLVAPNPMVGALIVRDGGIVAEGYHERYGGPHAEANAIAKIPPEELAASTLYVNLEPCSHFGKTPPCADLLIKHKIPTVIVAAHDTSAKVNGSGLQKLRQAGIKVISGVVEREARALNRRFFTFHEKRRPYVVLKWAQTENGYMAGNESAAIWISSEESRALVHEWRCEESAIMVGTATARIDNPKLTARPESGGEFRQPLRVVIDRNLTLPQECNLFDGSTKTLVINSNKEAAANGCQWARVNFSKDVIKQTLQILHELKITSVLVEGGARLLQSFLASNLWDEARVFSAPKNFLNGVRAPALPLSPISTRKVGPDTLLTYNNSSFDIYEYE